jgi:hypothetical protein
MIRFGCALWAGCCLLGSCLAASSAQAQADKQDKPIDFKQFIPPVLPPLQEALPPNSQLNSGVVGGSQTPYTTAPLHDTTPAQPAPGLKLNIPTR